MNATMQPFGSAQGRRWLRLAGAGRLGGLLGVAWPPLAAWGAPANDNFANATVLIGDFGTTNGSNIGATAEPGEPNHAGVKPSASIWYQWTATADASVEFDTFNSGCDTVLAVYVGSALAGPN